MAVEVVGREVELGALSAFLDRRGAVRGPIAIALEGEAGIGKSTLWRAAVEEARGRGWRVLSSRPAESERALAHAGLGDLFDGSLDEVLPELTAPRRRALEVALLIEDAPEGGVDQRALGVAVRSALEVLSEDGLVIAIDDLQWLDVTSASALGFALRRLPEADISLLWTRRLGEPQQSTAVEDALDGDRVERIRVGPLSVGATHQVLHSLLSHGLSRPTLLRLHAVSGGNPFYALELARALGADGALPGSDAAAARPRTAGGARLRPSRRLRSPDARGARARVRGCAPDAGTACRRGDRARRTRAGARCERDRARRRLGPAHASASGLGPLPRAAAQRAAARPRSSGRDRRGSARPSASPCALDRPARRRSRRPARSRGQDDGRAGRADGLRGARRARDAADAAEAERRPRSPRGCGGARAPRCGRGRAWAGAGGRARRAGRVGGRPGRGARAPRRGGGHASRSTAAEAGAAGARRTGRATGVDPSAAQPGCPLSGGTRRSEGARACGGRAGRGGR